MLRLRTVFLSLLSACSGSDNSARDAAPDVDNGTCGEAMRFTGEYVDWDSGTAFCGIYNATFAVQGGGATASTAPNGRFDLCVPAEAAVTLEISPPTAQSQCTTSREVYALPGLAVANKAVIQAGGFWSGRAFGTARQVIDPTKAQVFVHVDGNSTKVAIAATHAAAQARTTDTWGPGDTGNDVYFPDVDPAGGMTMLSAQNAIGTGPIPLMAGRMTNVTILVR